MATTNKAFPIFLAGAAVVGLVVWFGMSNPPGDAVTGTMTATDVEGLTDGTHFSVTTPATNGAAGIDAATGAWT